MTVVVADTSPLNYLILIEAIDLLPRLYKSIIIPAEVLG
jgi:predicted nucleic acid-binding protein